jgi:hypothetical protein
VLPFKACHFDGIWARLADKDIGSVGSHMCVQIPSKTCTCSASGCNGRGVSGRCWIVVGWNRSLRGSGGDNG